MATYLIGGRLVAGGGLDAGEITIRRLVPATVSCELILNEAETIDAEVLLPLTDPVTGVGLDLPQQLVPGRDFIGVMVDDTLVAAGPLWGDPFTFPYTSKLVAEGLWSYFDRRAVLPVLGAGQLPRDVTSVWASLSLRTIAKRLVEQAVSHPGAALPIDFEPDVPGTHMREYPGSDLMSVGDALRNLTQVEGGPDITFRPYITADRRHVRWKLMTGDPELTQEGADHYWDVSAPTPHATATGLERDGRDLASRVFVTGATIENELPNGSFEEGTEGYIAGGNAKTVTVVSGTASHGAKYLRWLSNSAGNSYLLAERSVSAEPGERFTLVVDARSSVPLGVRVIIRFLDADDVVISSAQSATTATTSGPWVNVACVNAECPAGTESVRAEIVGFATAADQVFAVDKFMLTRTSETVPFTVDEVQIESRSDSSLLTDAGFPLLESWDNRSSVLRPSTTQAYADEGVLRSSAHVTNRSLTARRGDHPKLGTYWPGEYAKVRAEGNARAPESTERERIIRVSFAADGDVSVELAPQRVVSGYPVPASNRRWLSNQLATLSRRISESNRGA